MTATDRAAYSRCMQGDGKPVSEEVGGGEAALERIPGDVACGLLILCDHASNAFPPGYGTLGLTPEQLQRHIAYDIGAAGVTRRLAALTGAPALLTRYSRLLIDPNRGEDDPTLIMRLSDGAIIPGNRELSEAEIDRRIRLFYRPYDRAVGAAVEAGIASGRPPAVFSIHSFTPHWKGRPRPWHVSILWDRDPRLPLPLIAALKEDRALVVGENEPYHGALGGDCLYRHATSRGVAHALVEIRQDLIADEAGQMAWAERLAVMLRRFLADAQLAGELAAIRHYGSQVDCRR